MKPVELYNTEPDYKRNYEYYKDIYELLLPQLQKLWDNKYNVNAFTDIIIDNEKLPLHINEFFTKEALRNFLNAIVNIAQNVGSFQAYKLFFSILFGDSIKFSYEILDGKILIFRVNSIDLNRAYWITAPIKNYIIAHSGERIVFTQLIKGLSRDRTQSFLQFISPTFNITYFEFSID